MKFDQASSAGFGVSGNGDLVSGCGHPQLELRDDDGPVIACVRCEKRWPMRGGPAWGGPQPPERVVASTRYLEKYEAADEAQRLTDFDLAYDRLSDAGACDAPGGAEWDRVRNEWIAAGQPEIEPFIRERANVGPDGVSWRPR